MREGDPTSVLSSPCYDSVLCVCFFLIQKKNKERRKAAEANLSSFFEDKKQHIDGHFVFGDGIDGSILTSKEVHEKHKAIPFKDLALEDTDEAFIRAYGEGCWRGLTEEGRDLVGCSCLFLLLGWRCDLSSCMFFYTPQAKMCFTRQLTRGELGCALSHVGDGNPMDRNEQFSSSKINRWRSLDL